MSQRWSPVRAALVVFGIVCAIGIVVAVAAATGTGTIDDEPYARGQQVGTGVGVLAVLAGAVAYFVQSKRTG